MSSLIPKTQKAAVIPDIGSAIQIEEIPVKQPSELAPGECLVKLECTGVCHTDLHAKKGDWPIPPNTPLVGGHEGVGKIVAIGENTVQSPVKVGDKVGIKWLADSCLACEMCRKGFEQNCPDCKLSGYNLNGTFCQYTVLYVNHVTPIPKNLDSFEAASILCAGVTVYNAIKKSFTHGSQWIVTPGAGGGVGHLAVQYANVLGLRVVAIDSGEEKRPTHARSTRHVDPRLGTDLFDSDVGGSVHVTIAQSAVAQLRNAQTPLPQAYGEYNVPNLTLSQVQTHTFTALSHPDIPEYGIRIKKSEFCDSTVNTYTGYIDIGSRHLFFYFFESRNDPDSDDVLFWTNGGPGGSSSLGLLMELGPCSIVSNNETKYNPYSWNTNANIFFIDQPAGVGYSYSDYDEKQTSTEQVADDIVAFLYIFFENFSSFRGRPFHFTGESYAGRYLPVFAAKLYDANTDLEAKGSSITPVNLSSVVIGNGGTDFFALLHSYYDMQCTHASIAPFQPISMCVRMKQARLRCMKRLQESCIDQYDLINCNAADLFCVTELLQPFFDAGYNQHDITMKCETLKNCYPEDVWIPEYINRPEIRELLGVNPSLKHIESFNIDMNKLFWAYGDAFFQNQLYVSELLERGIRFLIYAGTYDMIANWVGNNKWTLEMDWYGKEEFNDQPLVDWFIDEKAVGKKRKFKNLTFATITGAGHMAPHDKPVEALEMINRWLEDKEL